MKERLMNNFGLKILAFLSAVLLWLLVVNIDNPITDQTYNNIPVTVVNAEVLANGSSKKTFQIVDDTQTVSVTVRAKRSVLSKIKPDDIVAVADMKELALESQIPIRVTVENHEYREAFSTPGNLQVKLENEETKKFPIVPKTTGTVRDGYVLGDVIAEPEKVSIRGPKSVIDQIHRVEATVSVSGLSQDSILQSELVLYDQENNEIDQKLLATNLGTPGVSINVKLLRTKNIPVTFDISKLETAKGYEVAGITYEPQKITVCGEKEALESVSEISVPASALRISGLKEKQEKMVDISKYLPEGIKLAEENAGAVMVTIAVEKDGTKAFDLTMGSIEVNNLAEGLTMKYEKAEMLEILVRGPRAELEELDVDAIVSIDLKSYTTPGTYEVPVLVELPERCSLEKEVSVTIILKEY